MQSSTSHHNPIANPGSESTTRHDLVPPIHGLPAEVLGCIFRYLLMFPTPRFWTKLQDQYSCMRVCRRWHNVIDTTPLLWRAIEMWSDCETPSGSFADPARRIEKSGSCPLRIIIHDWRLEDSLSVDLPFFRITTRLLGSLPGWCQMLGEQTRQAESIDVFCDRREGTSALFPLRGAHPFLEELSVTGEVGTVDVVVASDFSAPLKKLRLEFLDSFQPTLLLQDIPSNKLEHLTLTTEEFPSRMQVMNFVVRCLNLRHLQLDTVIPSQTNWEQILPVTEFQFLTSIYRRLVYSDSA